jgi:starch-binding outer membrane protein, SusD/RagB family
MSIHTIKYKAIPVCGLLLLIYTGITSCKKQLVEAPRTIAVQNFYQTTLDANAAVAAIYAPLKPDGASTYYQIIQECLADFFIPNNSWLPLNNYNGLDVTNSNRTASIWTTFYLSIRNANIVIGKIPLSTAMPDSVKTPYIAEAKFLRALIYFQLVRNWGGVPLRTENNMSQINLARAPVDSVYSLIESDLAYAENNLPSVAPLLGRATKWAAKSVLADVYLQLQMYPQALAKSGEVIHSTLFSLVPVSQPNDFLNLFGPNHATATPEDIFSLKYARLSGQGNPMTLYEAHPNTPYANGSGYFSFYTDPTRIKIFKNWDLNDLRRQYDAYAWQFGRGDSTYLIRKFQDPQALGGYGGNDYPWYRYADVLMIYSEAANEVSGGPTAAAMEYLNQIHRRAYGFPPAAVSPVDYNISDYDQSSFLTLLVKERGYETLLEGKRWLELRRLGLAKTYILASKGLTVQDVILLWPIPLVETNYNTAINPATDQNPGY